MATPRRRVVTGNPARRFTVGSWRSRVLEANFEPGVDDARQVQVAPVLQVLVAHFVARRVAHQIRQPREGTSRPVDLARDPALWRGAVERDVAGSIRDLPSVGGAADAVERVFHPRAERAVRHLEQRFAAEHECRRRVVGDAGVGVDLNAWKRNVPPEPERAVARGAVVGQRETRREIPVSLRHLDLDRVAARSAVEVRCEAVTQAARGPAALRDGEGLGRSA